MPVLNQRGRMSKWQWALLVLAIAIPLLCYQFFPDWTTVAVIVAGALILVVGLSVLLPVIANAMTRRRAKQSTAYTPDDESDSSNEGVRPPVEFIGLAPKQGSAGAMATLLGGSGLWTSGAERAQQSVLARIRRPLLGWQPQQGSDRTEPQIRFVSVSGEGFQGKTVTAAMFAMVFNMVTGLPVLLLDVNEVGRTRSAFPMNHRPHDKTIYDLGEACKAGRVKSLADFEQYCFLTDAGVYVAFKPYLHQNGGKLPNDYLTAILKASQIIFRAVSMDGGNYFANAMSVAVAESDVAAVLVDPKSRTAEGPMENAATIMTTYPNKPVLAGFNLVYGPTDADVLRTLAEFHKPTAVHSRTVRDAFREYNGGRGLHVRIIPQMPIFLDKGPLWASNIPPWALPALYEFVATVVDLAVGKGDDIPRLPPGKFAKATFPDAQVGSHAAPPKVKRKRKAQPTDDATETAETTAGSANTPPADPPKDPFDQDSQETPRTSGDPDQTTDFGQGFRPEDRQPPAPPVDPASPGAPAQPDPVGNSAATPVDKPEETPAPPPARQGPAPDIAPVPERSSTRRAARPTNGQSVPPPAAAASSDDTAPRKSAPPAETSAPRTDRASRPGPAPAAPPTHSGPAPANQASNPDDDDDDDERAPVSVSRQIYRPPTSDTDWT